MSLVDEDSGLFVGVDVGGTFTDLVCFDGKKLSVVKVASTPDAFERGVLAALDRVLAARSGACVRMVHGSTVATNALLQRKGEVIAFVTTEGFGDMLLIGRQNRPRINALQIERPAPLAKRKNCFTLRERIGPGGDVIEPLVDAEIDRVVAAIVGRSVRHVAVCLLFAFANDVHEARFAARAEQAGLTVTRASALVPEFREYERASTAAINASLRPTVEAYLSRLEGELAARRTTLRVMHGGGGTDDAAGAAARAARMVLSGPAGGVTGAAFVARAAGFGDVIGYDMGGTSTDVALIRAGAPDWTTTTTIDGLPLALPMFDIHTVGTGGGSVAAVDAGGALRVGPRSAGAAPGPACYGRGGGEPTVTDANVLLGRIDPAHFLGGAMPLDLDAASGVIVGIAAQSRMSVVDAALGIVAVVEANMARAVRAVTSRRGFDPATFALLSFGGAGGLHACGVADALDIGTVIVPPLAGVLSALGMLVAPPVADASRTVAHLGPALDDDRLAAEFGALSSATLERVAYESTAKVEAFADARFAGQSHEITVRIERPSLAAIERAFRAAYAEMYGQDRPERAVETVTIRVRRIGYALMELVLPQISYSDAGLLAVRHVVAATGERMETPVCSRAWLVGRTRVGQMLIADEEATTFVPVGWSATGRGDGTVVLKRI